MNDRAPLPRIGLDANVLIHRSYAARPAQPGRQNAATTAEMLRAENVTWANMVVDAVAFTAERQEEILRGKE